MIHEHRKSGQLMTSSRDILASPSGLTTQDQRSAAERGSRRDRVVLVDAHVHYHTCFYLPAFLDSAIRNCGKIGSQEQLHEAPLACLLLADKLGQDTFQVLSDADESGALEEWSIHSTDEAYSLIADRGDVHLCLVAGRQIVSAEGIEVLALGCSDRFPDRMSLDESLAAAFESSATVVLPWGFGKWWFRRGSAVKKTILSHAYSPQESELFIGDQSGRAQLYPQPLMFSLAREVGMRILPGSDPLPTSRHVYSPCEYGFLIEGAFDSTSPAQSIREQLAESWDQPPICGSRAGLTRFVRDQVLMQARKLHL